MSGTLCVGVDPGLSGALVLLLRMPDEIEPNLIGCAPMPVLTAEKGKAHYDERRCAMELQFAFERVLALHPHVHRLLAIEDPGAIGGAMGASASTTYRQGYGVGLWFGIAAAMGWPFMRVKPQQWQTTQLVGLPRRPGQVKQSAMRRALELWPDLPVRPKSTGQGVADAALLARHALMGNSRMLADIQRTPPQGEKIA